MQAASSFCGKPASNARFLTGIGKGSGMNVLEQALQNRPLMAALLGWISAQVIKTILYACINRELRFERMVGSGGMPSSHAATVCALATSVARWNGLGSSYFALAFVLAVVVLHDASGVRLETGKQAITINNIVEFLENLTHVDLPNEELKELVGHTKLQVLVGGLLGIGIGFII